MSHAPPTASARHRSPALRTVAAVAALAIAVGLAGGACHRDVADPAPADPARTGSATPAASPDADPTRSPRPARLVAIGDLHGDLAATRAALRLAGAIDETDRWIGGALVVVQTGDVLDRGDDDRAILDLLGRLRDEAAAVGGALLALNGNHELMNAEGRVDGSPAALAAYADLQGLDLDDPAFADLPAAARPRAAAFHPGGPYALRLARHNVVAVVGDSVFVHGGLRPWTTSYGLERINAEVQAWLRGDLAALDERISGRDGPVWSRHYGGVAPDCATLAATLAEVPAARMVVGHTVQKTGISSACDGALWRIDTGMSSAYEDGPVQVLQIVGDVVTVLEELPAADTTDDPPVADDPPALPEAA